MMTFFVKVTRQFSCKMKTNVLFFCRPNPFGRTLGTRLIALVYYFVYVNERKITEKSINFMDSPFPGPANKKRGFDFFASLFLLPRAITSSIFARGNSEKINQIPFNIQCTCNSHFGEKLNRFCLHSSFLLGQLLLCSFRFFNFFSAHILGV